MKPSPRWAGAAVLLLPLSFGFAGGPALAAETADRPELREQVIGLVNQRRDAHGCRRPLVGDRRLTKSAQGHASDMAALGYFSHTSKDGRTWVQRIRRAGYPDPGGENIARGYPTPSAVVAAWMGSPSHRRNILACGFRRIGIGFHRDGNYWVQHFGF